MDLWASLRPSASSFHLISLKSTGRLTRLSAQWSRWTMDPTSDPRFQVCAGVTFDWGLWTLYFWVCMEIFFSCIFSIFGNIFVICAYPFYRRGALKSYLKGFKNKCLVFFLFQSEYFYLVCINSWDDEASVLMFLCLSLAQISVTVIWWRV